MKEVIKPGNTRTNKQEVLNIQTFPLVISKF